MKKSANDQSASGPAPAQEAVKTVIDNLEVSPESDLISVLQDVQGQFGYLPAAALEEISHCTKIPLSRIYGVVSFYAQFYTEPHGRHTIRCCRGTACHVKGGGRVLEAVEQELGISEGESTPDLMFYLETVACVGTCFLAPVMMIDNQYFGQLTPQRVKTVLRSYQNKE